MRATYRAWLRLNNKQFRNKPAASLKLKNMKTLKTLLTSAMTAIVLSAVAFTSTAAVAPSCRSFTMASVNPDIKKVVVTGNTVVYLIQGKRDWVSVENGIMDKVSIKQVGNTLRIHSSEADPVVLTVYVKDIYRIDASDNVKIRTTGDFNTQNLQVMLKDKASARVRANTVSLYTAVGDNAKLELIGKTGHHILKANGKDKLNMDKFAALDTQYLPGDVAVAVNTKPTANKISAVDSVDAVK
jgi:hypothetical protein